MRRMKAKKEDADQELLQKAAGLPSSPRRLSSAESIGLQHQLKAMGLRSYVPLYSPPQVWASESWPQPGSNDRQPPPRMPDEPDRPPTPERRRMEKEYMQNPPEDADYFHSMFGRPGGGAPRRDAGGNQVNTYNADREVRFVGAERVNIHETAPEYGRFGVTADTYKTPLLRDLNQQILEKNKRKEAERRREKEIEAAVLKNVNPFFANRPATPKQEHTKMSKIGLPDPHWAPSPEPFRMARSPSPPLHGTLQEPPAATYPYDRPYTPQGAFGTSLQMRPQINPETGRQVWPQEETRRNVKPWPSYDNVFTTQIPRAEQYERKSILLEGDNTGPPRQGYNARGSFGLPNTLKFSRHLNNHYPEAIVRDRDDQQRFNNAAAGGELSYRAPPPPPPPPPQDDYVPSQMRQQQQQQPNEYGRNADNNDYNNNNNSNNNDNIYNVAADQQKKQYLAELKQAADAKRRRDVERYLDEHGAYIDTATLLDHGVVGKPRYVGYNNYFNRLASDVTHPEILGRTSQFGATSRLISRSTNDIRDAYASDLEKQVVERERRKQLDSTYDTQRAKQHYMTEKAIWESGEPMRGPVSFKQSNYVPASIPPSSMQTVPNRYNPSTIMRT